MLWPSWPYLIGTIFFAMARLHVFPSTRIISDPVSNIIAYRFYLRILLLILK